MPEISNAASILLGGVAGSFAEAFVMPALVVRTRMMVQVGHIFFISEAVLPRKEAMHEIVHYASEVIIRSLTHSLAHIIYVYLPTYPPI